MTGRVFTKLFFSFVLVLAIGTAILDFSLGGVVEDSLREQLAQSLAGKARLLAHEANTTGHPQLQQLAERGESDAGAQVAFFTRAGAVLASSEPQPAIAGTPREITDALSSPHAFGQRSHAGTLYVAVAEDDIIVRLAASMDGIHATMHVLRRDLLIVSLVAMALATGLAAFLAHRGAARLERIVTFANRIA